MVSAQQYKVSLDVKMEVAGTSTLHDWEMVSDDGSGVTEVILNGGKLVEIKSLNFQTKAESLKSGKTTMDNYCYEALKTNKYKLIQYRLIEVVKITEYSNYYQIDAIGELIIAGKTRREAMVVKAFQEDGIFTFEGEKKIKMTDFDVTPPSVMFGTIKTGNDLVISFSVSYLKSSSVLAEN